MAIRDPKNHYSLLIDVVLKTGESFIGCDITSKPFGDHEGFVSAWIGDKIRIFPMGDVLYVNLYESHA